MPLLWLSLAYGCGVLLGAVWPLRLAFWLALAGLSLVGLLVRRLGGMQRFLPRRGASLQAALAAIRRTRLATCLHSIDPFLPSIPVPMAALSLALCLGAARYQAAQPHIAAGHIAAYLDQDEPYVIEGVLAAPPDLRDTYTQARLRAERLHPAGDLRFTPVQGDLLARLPPGQDWQYGDRLRLTGWLTTPSESESFNYRLYLARQDVYAAFRCRASNDETCVQTIGRGQGSPVFALIYRLRQRAGEALARLLPDPEASLLQGILLGLDSRIPAEVQQAFKVTGTSHVIAISGFNFAIVAGLFTLAFGKLLGRWRGMLAAMIGIILYAVLAGAGAGVVRAAIMGSLGVFARQVGRRQNGLNSLAVVAGVMAVYDPYVLWDVSFQLSFAATLGLVLYAEPLSAGFTALASRWMSPAAARRLAGPVGEYFLFTLAAQLTTLPLILYYFQRLSLISLIANPLILPVQPPIMFLGGLAALLGLAWEPAGQWFANLTWPFLAYTIRVVELLARAPAASFLVAPFDAWLAAVFYALLFGWTAFGTRLRAWCAARLGSDPLAGPGARLGWLGAAGLGLAALIVWQNVLALPDGRLHVTLLDVSRAGRSGDALLIQTPGGRAVLIDGGPSPSALSNALGRRLPLGRRRLDWLVLAASGEAQLAALPDVIERYPPGQALWAGSTVGSYSARLLRQSFSQQTVPVTLARPGLALDLGHGAVLRVLTAGRRGAVLLLEWDRFRLLLPIGPDFDDLEALSAAPYQGPLTALLLAESGYAPLNSPEWIARWRPQVVLLSVSPGDPAGLPDPETLDALQGYPLLRTDRHGWVRLSTDGVQLWVETEK